MKKLIIPILVIVLSSCVKDPPPVTYPHVMTLQRMAVAEFRLFAGSPEGAVEISTDGIDPSRFWGDLNSLTRRPDRIVYENSSSLTLHYGDTTTDPFWETRTYKLENDSLYTLNTRGMWEAIGKGCVKKAKYQRGLYLSKTHHGDTFTLDSGNGHTFPSAADFRLDEFTDVRDTLAIGGAYYYYE